MDRAGASRKALERLGKCLSSRISGEKQSKLRSRHSRLPSKAIHWEKPLENKESTGDGHGAGKLWMVTPSDFPWIERETDPTFLGKAAPWSAAHPKKSIWIQIHLDWEE